MLRECSINNYVAAYGPIKFNDMILKDNAYNCLNEAGLIDDFVNFINEDIAKTESCSRINEDSSTVWYIDETYNNMTIYEIPGQIENKIGEKNDKHKTVSRYYIQ